MNEELRDRLGQFFLARYGAAYEWTPELRKRADMEAEAIFAEIESAGYSFVLTEELEGYRHLWRVMVADAAVRDAMPEWMQP